MRFANAAVLLALARVLGRELDSVVDMESSVLRALVVVASATAVTLGWLTGGAAGEGGNWAGTTATPAQLQRCVDQWNWMNMTSWRRVSAFVEASPCRVTVAYGDPPSNVYYPCSLNRYRAYACPARTLGTSDGSVDPPPTTWNARIDGGRKLRLSRPPSTYIRPQKPEWVLRYAVENARIVPFDRAGRPRAGLRFVNTGVSLGACGAGLSYRYSSTLRFCEAGIQCFARRNPLRVGDDVACPLEPGSRTFRVYRARD